MLGINAVVNGILLAGAPWCTNVYMQLVVQGFLGITIGQTDAGKLLFLQDEWLNDLTFVNTCIGSMLDYC